MDYKYKLIRSSRKTAHLNSKCTVRYGKPEMNKGEIGVLNFIAYEARGYEPQHIYKMCVCYEDGAQFGPFLAVIAEKNEKTFTLEHVSHDGSTWTMTFEKP